jgi:hypothetical protein
MALEKVTDNNKLHAEWANYCVRIGVMEKRAFVWDTLIKNDENGLEMRGIMGENGILHRH